MNRTLAPDAKTIAQPRRCFAVYRLVLNQFLQTPRGTTKCRRYTTYLCRVEYLSTCSPGRYNGRRKVEARFPPSNLGPTRVSRQETECYPDKSERYPDIPERYPDDDGTLSRVQTGLSTASPAKHDGRPLGTKGCSAPSVSCTGCIICIFQFASDAASRGPRASNLRGMQHDFTRTHRRRRIHL